MYTKNDFLESVGHEIRVCQHLHSKLDPKKLDYQPGEGMRTTLELLQYLSWCAAGPTDALIHDWSVIGKYQEAIQLAFRSTSWWYDQVDADDPSRSGLLSGRGRGGRTGRFGRDGEISRIPYTKLVR